MPLSREEWRLRARACRGLAEDVTDPEVSRLLVRAAQWFAKQAEGPAVPFDTGGDRRRAATARAAERVHLRMTAGLRRQGESRFPARIADLSTVGFRVESHYAMPAGTRVFLTLPGLSAMSAHVVWSRDNALGCRFDAPIHPAVFERVIAAARAQG